jgi:NadR type nicotinamide-nucleotide adenylyltransferase
VTAPGTGGRGPRPLRVVLTGGECTGKTTLAARLSDRYAEPWAPEQARAYAEARAEPLLYEDVAAIARGQIAGEEAAAAAARRLVLLDTDLVSTVVYSQQLYAACPPWVEIAARERLGDLYLLHHPDVPWVAEAVRGAAADRERDHAAFRRILAGFGARVVDVRGAWDERERTAVDAIDGLLSRAGA